MVEELLKKSVLYNKNSPKFIINHFKINESIDVKSLDRELVYKFNYLPKKSKENADRTKKFECLDSAAKKKLRYSKYLNCEKKLTKQLSVRPIDFNEKLYRRLTIFNNKYKWVKGFQKRFHRSIVKALPSEEVPYLQSTIKNVSYATNANVHKGNKYSFIIDLENFFTKIDESKVKKTLKKMLALDNDISEIYTRLLTSPSDEPPYHLGRFVIGQGLPSSPILAFLCHASFFDYLYQECLSKGIVMTIYVDDIVFSSEKEIPQRFIDRIFRLFYINGLSINRKKVALVKNDGIKKITGGYVSKSGVKIKNAKHEELKVIYENLVVRLNKIDSYEDYFDCYNLFLKFLGNYYHLAEVEFAKKGKYVVPLHFSKYHNLIAKYRKFFPMGKNKINNKLLYSKNNIQLKDSSHFNKAYQKLKEEINCNKEN